MSISEFTMIIDLIRSSNESDKILGHGLLMEIPDEEIIIYFMTQQEWVYLQELLSNNDVDNVRLGYGVLCENKEEIKKFVNSPVIYEMEDLLGSVHFFKPFFKEIKEGIESEGKENITKADYGYLTYMVMKELGFKCDYK